MVTNVHLIKAAVQADEKNLDALLKLVQSIDWFHGQVVRHGYDSERAREGFKRFAGDFGTLEAMVTHFRNQRTKAEDGTFRPTKKYDASKTRTAVRTEYLTTDDPAPAPAKQAKKRSKR
jgi:hypothetical protein